MMNEQGLMRLAHDVYKDDDITLASSSGGSLVADDIFRLMDDLRKECCSGDAQLWTIHPRTYALLQWWQHCSKAYRLPRRKLRKCAMRRVYQRRQHARGRYL